MPPQIYSTLRNITSGKNTLLNELQDSKQYNGLTSLTLQDANPVVVVVSVPTGAPPTAQSGGGKSCKILHCSIS